MQVLQTQNIPINNQNNPITAVGSPTVRPLTPSNNNPSNAAGTANGTVRATCCLPLLGQFTLCFVVVGKKMKMWKVKITETLFWRLVWQS